MSTLISKGEYRFREPVAVGILLGVGLGFGICHFIKLAKSHEYTNYPLLIIVFALAFLFTFLVFKTLQKTIAIDVYDTHLVYKNIAGNKRQLILPNQIIRYGETTLKKNSHIYIQLNNKYFSFSIASINNDIELLHQLLVWGISRRDNIPEKHFANEKIETKLLNVFFVVTILGLTYETYIHKPYYPTQDSLTPIVGNLSKSPKKKSNKGRITQVSFSLKQYPGFAFLLNKTGYHTIHKTALFEWSPGREAVFWITNYDFHKYFIKDTALNFIDKHFMSGSIDIYGVTINGNNLLKHQDLALAMKDHHDFKKSWSWIFILALLGLLFRKQFKERFNPYRVVK